MVLENFILWSQSFIDQFGYLAVFILGAIIQSTLLIPTTVIPVIIPAVTLGLNPLFVGIFAGLGFATGQLTGYLAGLGGSVVLQKYMKKSPRWMKTIKKLFKRFGFWFILVYSSLPIKPIPFDVLGILSGIYRYDLKKFYLAVAVGYIIMSLLIAYSWSLGFSYIKSLFS